MKDKVWSKPKLVVLVRSKPQEAILWVCKTFIGGIGAGTYNSNCTWMDNPTGAQNCVLGDCYGTVET